MHTDVKVSVMRTLVHVMERDRFCGGASVMMWGGISNDWRTPLVPIQGTLNAIKYCDDILVQHVIPFL